MFYEQKMELAKVCGGIKMPSSGQIKDSVPANTPFHAPIASNVFLTKEMRTELDTILTGWSMGI